MMRRRICANSCRLAAIGLIATLVCLALPASQAQARDCGQLPVRASVLSQFGDRYALQYDKKLPVYVETQGPVIKNWRIELYTFDGFRLAESRKLGDFAVGDKGRARLRFPMQAGKYTLVVKGEVAGCGELQKSKVVSFRDCRTQLPLSVVEKPGGVAADYGGFLSVQLQTRSSVIRKLSGRLYSFDGDLFGRSKLSVLFGSAFMHNRLTKPLQPGGYSFIVEGRIDQPRECGPKSKNIILKFK